MTKQVRICIIIFLFLAAILSCLFTVQKTTTYYTPAINTTNAVKSIDNVTLYILERCSYCLMAKNLLNKYNIEYDAIDISDKPELRRKLMDETKQRTVPMIFINNKFIGGYTQLLELEKSGFFE